MNRFKKDPTMMKTFAKVALSAAVASVSMTVAGQALEEVVVTAQKRVESLQDVPISVTAISGEQIQDASIRSFGELSAYVPNFSVTENAVNSIIEMRGISIGANQSFEQSVGLFVDGVHYGRSRQTRLGLFDLEQIEVLRGPQGILFGKNTLAGAVNIRTAAPKVGEGLSGRVAASFESDNGEYFEGHISGSLTDNFAMRLAVMDRSIDGYNKNTAPNAVNSNMPATDETIVRLGAQWEPSEATSVALRYTYSDFLRTGSTGTVTKFGPTVVNGTPLVPASNAAMYAVMGFAYPGFQESITDAYRDGLSIGGNGGLGGQGSERLDGTDTENHEFSLNIEHEFGNGMTLNLVTGVSQFEFEDGIDADFLPVKFIGRSDNQEYEQFSQEIRLASDLDGRFSWVAGGNYIDSKQEIDRMVAVDGTFGQPGITALITGGLPTILAYNPAQLAGAEASFGLPAGSLPVGVEGLTMWNQVGRLSAWQQETESWAVFFQGTFNITDNLTITAGVRYTEEEKSADAQTWLNSTAQGLATKTADPLTGVLTAGDFGNFLQHSLQGAFFDSYAHHFIEDRDTDQTIPAVSLTWTPSDDHLLYASYSEGFKSGGFNAVDDQNPIFVAAPTAECPDQACRTQPGPGFEYDDETAWSFEVGGKHTFLDGRMRLNWAYFNSEFEDQQVSTFVGLGFVVTNASSTEIQGFELDAAFQATEKLRLNLALGTVDGEYGVFEGAGCTAQQQAEMAGLGALTPNSPATSVTVDGRTCSQKFLGNGVPSGQSQNLSGVQIGAAEWSGSFGAQYMQPVGSMVWFTELDVNFTDDYFMTGDLDGNDVQSGYEYVNLRTGLRGDNWMLMLYGRNIGDELVASGAADVPLARGSHFQYRARGEVWGVQAAWEF
jgi:outer membrane receptor protein involved in Fe transport